MNETYDFERALDRWFAAGSTFAPEGSIDRAVATAVVLPQAGRPLLRRLPVVRSPARALLAAGAIIAIVASIALGPWVGRPSVPPPATRLPPSETTAPSGQPTASADARPSTSPAVEPSNSHRMTMEFTSNQHRYSIRYPKDWGLDAAPSADVPDRIRAPQPSESVLSLRRFRMPDGVVFLDFAEDHLRHRAQPGGCYWGSSGIIYIPARQDTLHEFTVDEHPGAYRSECSHVDAVVEDGDEFLGITLQSGTRKATGDVWWFERFIETLVLDTNDD